MLSFNLGPLALSVSQGLMIGAFLVALSIGKLTAGRRDIAIGDVLFNLALIGFIAARCAFVARYYSNYGLDPVAWIDIRDGGFDVIVGLLVVLLYAGYLALRQAALRIPLAAALFGGLITWGLTGGLLGQIENQASRPPEHTLYTLDGRAIDLASLQAENANRPMVVNLWATWCPPCRAEMPLLQQAQQERSDVLFVFVNQAENAATIEHFMSTMDLTMDHVVQDRHRDIGRLAGSAALPTTLFYNAEGRLVDSHLGLLSSATLAQALDRLGAVEDSAKPATARP